MKKLFLLLALSSIAQVYTAEQPMHSNEEQSFTPFGGTPRISLPDLGPRRISEEGMRALTQAPFPQLQELDLSQVQIDEEGVSALAQASFIGLRSLSQEPISYYTRKLVF